MGWVRRTAGGRCHASARAVLSPRTVLAICVAFTHGAWVRALFWQGPQTLQGIRFSADPPLNDSVRRPAGPREPEGRKVEPLLLLA